MAMEKRWAEKKKKYTSTPQLPLKEPHTPSNRDQKASNGGTLGDLGMCFYQVPGAFRMVGTWHSFEGLWPKSPWTLLRRGTSELPKFSGTLNWVLFRS